MAAFDAGQFTLISGLVAIVLGFLGPIIGKRQRSPAEAAQDRRANFETMFEATMKMLDAKDQEIKRCREECAADIGRAESQRDAEIARAIAEEARMQSVIDKLREHTRRQNETLAAWALDLGKDPPPPVNENGDPR